MLEHQIIDIGHARVSSEAASFSHLKRSHRKSSRSKLKKIIKTSHCCTCNLCMSQVLLSYDNYKVEKNRGKNVSRRRRRRRRKYFRVENGHFLMPITFFLERIWACGLREICSVGLQEQKNTTFIQIYYPEGRELDVRKWPWLLRLIYSTLAPRAPEVLGRGGTRYRGCWIRKFLKVFTLLQLMGSVCACKLGKHYNSLLYFSIWKRSVFTVCV